MINKVTLVGNVGKDPEVKYMPSGDPVANITLATSETWKDKQTGEKKESTEWHRVVIFGKLADIAAQYVKKGSKLYIEGKLKTRKWQDQSGQDKYSTEVVLQGFNGEMKLLNKVDGAGAQPQQQASYQQQAPAQQAPQMAPQQQAAYQQAPAPQQPMQQPMQQQAAPQQNIDDQVPF